MGTPYPYPECKVNNAFVNITEIILDIVVCSLLKSHLPIQDILQKPKWCSAPKHLQGQDLLQGVWPCIQPKRRPFSLHKEKIYMNLYLFQVQNNGSSANLMPHDIADLGGRWRNLKLITVGNVKVLIKVTAPPQTSTWTKKWRETMTSVSSLWSPMQTFLSRWAKIFLLLLWQRSF